MKKIAIAISVISLFILTPIAAQPANEPKTFISKDHLVEFNLDTQYTQTAAEYLAENADQSTTLQLRSSTHKLTIITTKKHIDHKESLQALSEKVREQFPNANIVVREDRVIYILDAIYGAGAVVILKPYKEEMLQIQIFFNTNQSYDYMQKVLSSIKFNV